MQQLNFTTNPNGKLFLPIFSDFRLFDNEKFYIGNCIEIIYKNQSLGFAKVISHKSFLYKRISDTAAFINCGKSAPYQATLLQKFYPQIKFTSDTCLMNIVFEYTERNLGNQEVLITEWWKDIAEHHSKIA